MNVDESFNFNDRGFGFALNAAAGSFFGAGAADDGRFSGSDRLDGLATAGHLGQGRPLRLKSGDRGCFVGFKLLDRVRWHNQHLPSDICSGLWSPGTYP